MAVVEFAISPEVLQDPKQDVIFLQMPMQLAALVLGLRNADCKVNIKKKGQTSTCKLEGNVNDVITKMISIFELICRRKMLMLANITLSFNVRPEIVGSILSKASDVRKNLFVALHAYNNFTASTVCLKGQLDRVIQLYLGIQRLDKKYGGPEKFFTPDVLFKTKHIGRVPSKAIPTPLLHKHKEMQTETQTKIAYGDKILNKQFKEATVTGYIWNVERAVNMIYKAVGQKVKKLQKKNKKLVRQAQPLNPELEDGSASINVPSNMIGLVIGKQGSSLKQIETTFDVKVEIKKEADENVEFTKIVITSKRQNGDRQIFDAVFWIHSMIRRASKSRSKDQSKNKPKTFSCGICLENDVPIHDGIACTDFSCDNEDDTVHSFCNDCLTHLAEQLSNPFSELPVAIGGVGLRCPEVGCPNVMLLSLIRWLLNKRDLERLEQRCMRESIRMAGLQNLVTCHGCENMVILESGNYFGCPECKRNQCRDCPREYDRRHIEKTCKQLDDEEAKERLEAVQRGEINKVHEEMAAALIRTCPGCKVPMTKLIGCNKITCHQCGMKFCYICLAKNIDYNHFGTNRGQCELFVDFNDMGVNQDRMRLLEQRIQQIQVAAY